MTLLPITQGEAGKDAEMENELLPITRNLTKVAGSPRRQGVPKTDVERVMSHYGVSRKKALGMLKKKSASKLLPKRGTGLSL